MGLEMKARGGRLVHIRETHRVTELDELGPPCDDPPPWGCFVVLMLVVAALLFDY